MQFIEFVDRIRRLRASGMNKAHFVCNLNPGHHARLFFTANRNDGYKILSPTGLRHIPCQNRNQPREIA